jgi:cell division protein ZapA
MSNETVIVQILDKDYQISCPPGQQEALEQSAHYLDKQMKSIREGGKVIGLERIAVMAALNISNELLSDDGKARKGGKVRDTGKATRDKLKRLNNKLEDALHRFRQLEIN